MRVIEPYQLRAHKQPKRRKTIWRTVVLMLAVVLIVVSALGAWIYNLPLPKISANVVTVTSKGGAVALPWPSYGQSSIGAVGYGLLASTKNQKPVPIASVAKVMTAFAVLRAKPINKKDQGPTITLTDADVDLYNHYLDLNGSVVAVDSGEQITERQALEAMLLPSANNLADSLVIWAFGSTKNYASYANNLAKEIGLKNTTITGASGFDVSTVSTAADLVRLGLMAMNNPVITAIVSEQTATIPVEGSISNVNFLLGRAGIVGIKTGNTDEAGGCYLFAASRQLSNGQKTTVVGAILAADSLGTAMKDGLAMINASFQNFASRKLISKGDKLGYYDLPWGGQAQAVAADDLTVWSWKGSDLSVQIFANDIAVGFKAGAKVGEAQNANQSIGLRLADNVSPPSKTWRLLHRL